MYCYVIITFSTHTLVHAPITTAATNTVGIIGGAVGGIVLFILLITLCIIMRHVHAKRKSNYSTGKARFMTPVSFLNHPHVAKYNSSCDLELTNMKSNITGTYVGIHMDARTCEWYILLCSMFCYHFKVIFVIALVEKWKRQLGNYMIDYDTLEIGRMIAEGVRIQIALLL